MQRRISISLFVLDLTAVLLALFGFLTALSGLCLVKPEVVERATLGALDSYSVCARLHLGWVAVVTITTAIIHGVAGLDLWLVRLGVNGRWLWPVGVFLASWFIYIYFA
ncbi:MAG: hypothetical protein ABWK05_02680 [Pyrobaculum sp.]